MSKYIDAEVCLVIDKTEITDIKEELNKFGNFRLSVLEHGKKFPMIDDILMTAQMRRKNSCYLCYI